MTESALLQNEFLITATEEAAPAEILDRDQTTDSQLIVLALAGDETAFEQIFERYKRLVAVIAARYFQHPEQIEEIIQITFTKVFFEMKNFRGEHRFSLASWLGRITTNACFDVLKKPYKKSESLACDLSSEEELSFIGMGNENNTEENLIDRDLAAKLLQNLHPRDRALMQMLYAEEMSIDQVAAATGWSNSKIRVRAFRARNALRKVLRKFI